jgi:hypothetical protein
MLEYIRRRFSGEEGSQLDQRIRSVRKSYVKQLREIEEKYPMRAGMCCQACAYSPYYSNAAARAERTKIDLIRLLNMRSRCDGAEVQQLKAGYV